MQDREIFFATLVFAAFLSIIYMGVAWLFKKRHPQFLNVAIIYGSTVGLASGIKLCYTLCTADSRFNVGYDDKVAIFVGGLAICWVSVLGIVEGFKDKK